jgi:hypothetical protein
MRGLCGAEAEATCSVLRNGRLTFQRPTVPADRASPVCKDGGRVYILDGLAQAKDGEKDGRVLSDSHASDSLEKSVGRLREVARQAGCSAVTLRGAEGGVMIGPYHDPKAVAIVHVGHGDLATGRPVAVDGQGLSAEALDKARVSSRLRSVESLVCGGGKAEAEFKAKLPATASYHGPDAIITVERARAMAEGPVQERLDKALHAAD